MKIILFFNFLCVLSLRHLKLFERETKIPDARIGIFFSAGKFRIIQDNSIVKNKPKHTNFISYDLIILVSPIYTLT